METMSAKKGFPLTWEQRRMYELQEQYPKSTLFHTFYFVKFGEKVKLPELAEAISQTLQKHQSILTTLHRDEDGKICQRFTPEIFQKVEVEEIAEEEFESCKEELKKPYKMLDAPLYRCRLLKTEKAAYLYIGAHHILFDGISAVIIFQDVLRVMRGEEVPEDSYYEILEEREAEKKSPLYEEAEAFYEKLFSKKVWSSIPIPDFDSGKSSIGRLKLPVSLAEEELRNAERAWGMNRSGLGILATALSVAACNQASDIMITWVHHGRRNRRMRRTTGPLYREMPAAFSFAKRMTFGEILKGLRQEMKQGIEYSLYPYIAVENNDRIACFLDQGDIYDAGRSEELPMQAIPLIEKTTGADNALYVYPFRIEGKSEVTIEYDTGLYRRESMERFGNAFRNIFLAMLQNAGEKDMTLEELMKKAKII